MQQLFRLVLFAASLLYLLLCVVILFYPETAEQIILQSRSSGDLYQMAKIRRFRHKLLAPLPPIPTTEFNSAQIITMGDSFFNTSVGYPILPDSIASSTGLLVHNYNIQGSGEAWRKTNPLEYLQQVNATYSAKPRLLLLESVDRGLVMRYGSNKLGAVSILTEVASPAASNTKTQPKLVIESVINNVEGLTIAGWVVDNEDGSPLNNISLVLDGQKVNASLNHIVRADVSQYFNRSDWQNGGFKMILPGSLSVGKHTISVVAQDSAGSQSHATNTIFIIPSSDKLFPKLISAINYHNDKINEFIDLKLKSADYFLLNNPVSLSLSELIATLKFELGGIISSLTPRYTLNPNVLFYKDEVAFVEAQPNDDSVMLIADNFAYIRTELKRLYNIDLIILAMPNKYSLFYKQLDPEMQNTFHDSLIDQFRKRNLSFVDVNDALISSSVFAYEPADTHLSKAGAEIVIAKILDVLSNSSVATLSARRGRDIESF